MNPLEIASRLMEAQDSDSSTVDDSDMDPDYKEDEVDSESGSEQEREGEEVDIFMEPPVERANGDTDVDSDDSDSPTGKVDHLPRRLLQGGAQKRTRRRKEKVVSDSEEEEEVPMAGNRNVPSQWSKTNKGFVGSKIPIWNRPQNVNNAGDWRVEELTSAYEFYKLFQSDSFVNQVSLYIFE